MISFTYFDLGGVVEKDFSGSNKWQEFKRDLGILPEKDIEFENFWEKYEPAVCTGRDVETLLPLIRKQFDIKIPDGYSLLIDGFVNRFEANKSIWPVINEIHKICPVGLLTNMYPGMLTAIKQRGLLPKVEWDEVIDSSVVGIQKPDIKIFQLAERKARVRGKNILFVENSTGNIKAAKEFGWQVFHYDSANYELSSKKLGQAFKSFLMDSL